jgi:hypothetical protein
MLMLETIEESWCEEDERLIKMLEHIVKVIFCNKTTNIYFFNGWFCIQGHSTTQEEECCYNDTRTPIRRWHKWFGELLTNIRKLNNMLNFLYNPNKFVELLAHYN